MKKIFGVYFCVHLIVCSSAGFAQQWRPVSSSVAFKIKMFGANVTGTLGGLTTQLTFDPENLAKASLQATLDARSVDTDNSLRDRHLREKEDFFDTERHPTIKMRSVRIEKLSSGYVGYFDLTIKQTTKQLKVPFDFLRSGTNATFTSTFVINRRDWGLGGGTLGMSNDVTVSIKIVSQAQP